MGSERIRGKVAVVTGATGGIGVAIARSLAHAGARLVLSARNAGALEALAAALRHGGTDVVTVVAEVTDPASMERLVAEATSAMGDIDIIVWNAGIYIRGAVKDLALEDIRRSMETNYFGAVHLIRAALPRMLARGAGHIVAVSSVDGKKGLMPDAAYAASKYALTGFMDVLRQELRGTGVFASTIFPERVDTPMIEHLELPLMSRRLPPSAVAQAVLKAIRQRRREIVVSFAGPKFLIVASSIWPAMGDWLVRVFRLQGVEVQKGVQHG